MVGKEQHVVALFSTPIHRADSQLLTSFFLLVSEVALAFLAAIDATDNFVGFFLPGNAAESETDQ